MKSDPWDYELVVDADDSIERVVSDLWYTDDPFFRPRERNFNEIRYLALHIRVPSEMIRRVIRRGVDNCYRRHYLEKPTGEKRVLLEPVDDLKIIQQKIQRRLLREQNILPPMDL